MRNRNVIAAEFGSSDRLASAIREVRRRGYADVEAYTPYAIHDVQEARGLGPSRAPLIMFVAGMLGAGAAYLLQFSINAVFYPLNVGARPDHFFFAFVPITFEMGVLSAAAGGVLALIGLGRLFRMRHPLERAPRFEQATKDRFWLEIGGIDEDAEATEVAEILAELGATEVVWLGRRGQ